jgi:hypothetical protein
MKKAHERWVSINLDLSGQAAVFHYIPDPAYQRLCEHKLIHIWKYPKAHVFCCSYGSIPVEILPGTWKASGIIFRRLREISTNCTPENIVNIAEAQPDVEYKCDADGLEVTYYTFDPRVKDLTPFITMRFEHDRPVDQRVLVLRLSPDTSPVEPIIEFLRSSKGADHYAITEKLFQLRNIGMSRPRHAREWLKEFWHAAWCDGANAETMKEIENQFDIIIEAEQID